MILKKKYKHFLAFEVEHAPHQRSLWPFFSSSVNTETEFQNVSLQQQSSLESLHCRVGILKCYREKLEDPLWTRKQKKGNLPAAPGSDRVSFLPWPAGGERKKKKEKWSIEKEDKKQNYRRKKVNHTQKLHIKTSEVKERTVGKTPQGIVGSPPAVWPYVKWCFMLDWSCPNYKHEITSLKKPSFNDVTPSITLHHILSIW